MGARTGGRHRDSGGRPGCGRRRQKLACAARDGLGLGRSRAAGRLTAALERAVGRRSHRRVSTNTRPPLAPPQARRRCETGGGAVVAGCGEADGACLDAARL